MGPNWVAVTPTVDANPGNLWLYAALAAVAAGVLAAAALAGRKNG